MSERPWTGGMIRLSAGVKFENRRNAPPEVMPKNSNDMKTIIRMLRNLSGQDLQRLYTYIDREVKDRELEAETFSAKEAKAIALRGLAQLRGN